MNATEFNEWRKHHGLCVAGFDEWLAKGRTADDQREVLRLWADALSGVSLTDAKEASKALMRGDIERVAFGEHPAAIRRHARSLVSKRYSGGTGSRRTLDGHEIIDCRDCHDTGFATCYSPACIHDYVTNRDAAFRVVPIRGGGTRRIMPSLNYCAVPCRCGLGLTKQTASGARYDPDRWILKTNISIEEQIAELVAGIEERLQASLESRPNYSHDLAEWNR